MGLAWMAFSQLPLADWFLGKAREVMVHLELAQAQGHPLAGMMHGNAHRWQGQGFEAHAVAPTVQSRTALHIEVLLASWKLATILGQQVRLIDLHVVEYMENRRARLTCIQV